jgi:hypothetical protein
MTHEEMFAASPIKVGQKYKFDYPETFTTLPEYTAHRGVLVEVIRPCTEDEADVLFDSVDDIGEQIVDRMFKVRAVADGWEGEAWETELLDA